MEPDPQSRLRWSDPTLNKKTVDNSVKNTKNENVYNQKIESQNIGGPVNMGKANIQSMQVNNYGQEGSPRSAGGTVTEYLLNRITELENEVKSLKNENDSLRKVAVGNKRIRVQFLVVKTEINSWQKFKLSKNTA